MKSLTNLLAVCVIALSLLPAKAAIDLTPYGPPPVDRTKPTIEAWLADLVTTYNTTHTALPDPGSRLFRVNSDDTTSPDGFPTFSGGLSIALPMGHYDYITLHWLGSNGGATQAFYIGDESSGNITFNSPWQLSKDGTELRQYDLSWYAGFVKITPVPEPTTMIGGVFTLFMFGAGALRSFRKNPTP